MEKLIPDKIELKKFYVIMLSFISLGIFMLAKENYWIALLPLVVLIAYLAVFSLDVILLIIAFFTPLAIVLNDKGSE